MCHLPLPVYLIEKSLDIYYLPHKTIQYIICSAGYYLPIFADFKQWFKRFSTATNGMTVLNRDKILS